MANHKSALKRAQQERKRRLRNRIHRSRLRTALKRIRAAATAGEVETVQNLLPGTVSLVDHTASLGVIHRNAAARTKSRLYRALQELTAQD
jgi:small subunit ribosomal protein S20